MKSTWAKKKLGEVCMIERGGSPRPITDYLTDSPDGINWIKIGDAIDGSKYITSTKERIRPEGIKKSRFVRKGDFILSNSMSFGKPYILGIDGCIHDGWLVIRDQKGLFDKSFLYYYLGSDKMFRQFEKLAAGGVVKNLNSQLVRSVDILVPPMEEQGRIVAELDLLTGITNKKKAQLRDLDALAGSIFYEMFGDLMLSNRWPRQKVKELCIVNPSKRDISNSFKVSDSVSFLPMEDLSIHAGYAEPKQTRQLGEVQGSYTFFAENDVLLAKVTPCFENGKVGMATNLSNGIGFGSSEFIVIRPVKNLLKETIYFLALTQHFVSEASKQLTGTSGLRRVPRSFIENLEIAVPPLELQQTFASRIAAIERQKSLLRDSIASTQTLLSSRMNHYFGE